MEDTERREVSVQSPLLLEMQMKMKEAAALQTQMYTLSSDVFVWVDS